MAFDAFLILRNPSNLTNLFRNEVSDTAFAKYNTVAVSGFTFGEKNPAVISSIGAGSGKATFDPLSITKPASLNSPGFITACSMGMIIPRATLVLRRTGGSTSPNGGVFAVYSFGTVLVSSFEESGSAGDDVPTENITFQFGQFAYHYYVASGAGGTVTAYKSAWDVVKNITWTGYSPLDGPVSQ